MWTANGKVRGRKGSASRSPTVGGSEAGSRLPRATLVARRHPPPVRLLGRRRVRGKPQVEAWATCRRVARPPAAAAAARWRQPTQQVKVGERVPPHPAHRYDTLLPPTLPPAFHSKDDGRQSAANGKGGDYRDGGRAGGRAGGNPDVVTVPPLRERATVAAADVRKRWGAPSSRRGCCHRRRQPEVQGGATAGGTQLPDPSPTPRPRLAEWSTDRSGTRAMAGV